MSKIRTYVLTKNGEVYGVYETEQAAKNKAVAIAMGGWYTYGAARMLTTEKATWAIYPQVLEVED
jgi:hypothetical protein